MSISQPGSSLVEHMLVIGPNVALIWAHVHGAFIESCLDDESAEDYVDHLYWEVFNCKNQLWVFYEGNKLLAAIVSRIFRAFSGKVVCEMFMVAGNSRPKWEAYVSNTVGDWAKRENGADILAVTGRPGWTRTIKQYGFNEYSRTLYKYLGDNNG